MARTKQTQTQKLDHKKVEELNKKARRWHPGTVALREIRAQQKSTEVLLKKLPFQRLVKEILQEHEIHTGSKGDVPSMPKLSKTALESLREGANDYLVNMFKKANNLAIHANRKTIFVKDIRLLQETLEENSSTSSNPTSFKAVVNKTR